MMGLTDMGYKSPTPIQQQAIPEILEGNDILASAQTGTGKTAAFAIPLIEKLTAEKKHGIRALILAPTRELASQIDEQFWSIGYHAGVTSASVYGGTDWSSQEQALREGVNIVVATPGRLLDHIKVSGVDFSGLEFLVLDEADRMLDMGFLPDVKAIIGKLPQKRQTLLFSATFSDRIEKLTKEIANNPKRINVSSFKPAEGVTQLAYRVHEEDKVNLVLDIFDKTEVMTAIVFTSTKRGADSLGRALHRKGVKVSSMHGDRDQKEREITLGEFKSGKINVIVATDVMSRGIDVTGISHVINYNVPRDLDDYIHRIGRTARAEQKGTAITLVSPQDGRFFQVIQKEMQNKLQVIDLPEYLKPVERPSSDSETNQRPSSRGSRPQRNAPGRPPRRAPRPRPELPAEGGRKPEPEITVAQAEKAPQPRAKSGSRNRPNRKDPENPRQRPQGDQSQARNSGIAKQSKPGDIPDQQKERIQNVLRPFEKATIPSNGNGQKNGNGSEKPGIFKKIFSIFGGS